MKKDTRIFVLLVMMMSSAAACGDDPRYDSVVNDEPVTYTASSVTAMLANSYYINYEVTSNRVLMYFSGSVVTVYESASASGQNSVAQTMSFNYEVTEWTDQGNAYWLITTPDENGNNQGSMGIYVVGSSAFDAYASEEGGFSLGGQFVNTDVLHFNASTLELTGVTIEEN